LPETFPILRSTERGIITKVRKPSCKERVILVTFNWTWTF